MRFIGEDCNFCKHFLEAEETNGIEKIYKCKAFPQGIPPKYRQYGGCLPVYGISEKGNPLIAKPHNKVVKGQVGNYIFESIFNDKEDLKTM